MYVLLNLISYMSIKILILLAKSMFGPRGKVHVDLFIGCRLGLGSGAGFGWHYVFD